MTANFMHLEPLAWSSKRRCARTIFLMRKRPPIRSGAADPAAQLERFVDKYDPAIASLIRDALAKMRALLPHCVEFVYDNYYALVIGFGPTEKPSEALFSIAAYPNHVSLCFLHGAALHDPHGLLKGNGNRVRHIRVEGAQTFDDPSVQQLIAQSLAMSGEPFDSRPRRTLIRAIAVNPRLRRPAR